MKTQMAICLGLSLITAASAFASKEAGNGGGAFICTDPTQSEFLDLAEARTSLGLTPVTSSAPVEDQIQAALKRLNPRSMLYGIIQNIYAQVRAAREIVVAPGYSIAWPSDEKNVITKNGCTPQGMILFNDADNSMQIDKISLESMPPTQQAAAWVHETIYKFFRDRDGDTDSIRARKVVGLLFSRESDQQVRSTLLSDFGMDTSSNSTDGPADVYLDEAATIIVDGRMSPVIYVKFTVNPESPASCAGESGGSIALLDLIGSKVGHHVQLQPVPTGSELRIEFEKPGTYSLVARPAAWDRKVPNPDCSYTATISDSYHATILMPEDDIERGDGIWSPEIIVK